MKKFAPNTHGRIVVFIMTNLLPVCTAEQRKKRQPYRGEPLRGENNTVPSNHRRELQSPVEEAAVRESARPCQLERKEDVRWELHWQDTVGEKRDPKILRETGRSPEIENSVLEPSVGGGGGRSKKNEFGSTACAVSWKLSARGGNHPSIPEQ